MVLFAIYIVRWLFCFCYCIKMQIWFPFFWIVRFCNHFKTMFGPIFFFTVNFCFFSCEKSPNFFSPSVPLPMRCCRMKIFTVFFVNSYRQRFFVLRYFAQICAKMCRKLFRFFSLFFLEYFFKILDWKFS